MIPTSELIVVLRKGAQGLDPTVRFLILEVCDRLERQTKDNELLMKKIEELRSKTVKTNADRIRAMSDEELEKFINHFNICDLRTNDECKMSYCACCEVCVMDWLQQPAEEGG